MLLLKVTLFILSLTLISILLTPSIYRMLYIYTLSFNLTTSQYRRQYPRFIKEATKLSDLKELGQDYPLSK